MWNACVLFFPATLLPRLSLRAFLHALARRTPADRRQTCFHLFPLLAPLAVLPLTMGDAEPPTSANPVWWLLRTMMLTVGLPFFVVSTAAPLLQRWFATLPVPSARDPYFLYAASNLGSMLALLTFPLVLEPLAGAQHQTWVWAGGYLMLAAVTAACALVVRAFANEGSSEVVSLPTVASEPLSGRTRLRWVVLSFVPSSLLLGVTTYISTDIAAVPLLWVMPLAMYLGTFVLAFSPR